MMKKLAIGVATLGAVALIGGGTYFFVQKSENENAIRILASFQTQLKEIAPKSSFRYQTVNVDIFNRTMTIEKLHVAVPSSNVVIDIASLVLSGDENLLLFANFNQIQWIQNAEDKINVGSAHFSNLDVVALLDLQKLQRSDDDEIVELLKKISVKNIKFANLNANIKSEGKSVKIGSFESGDITGGNWGSFKVDNLKLGDKTGGVNVDNILVKNIDLIQISKLEDKKAQLDLLGFDKIIISGVSFNKDDIQYTIKRVGMDNVNRLEDVLTSFRLFIDELDIPISATKKSELTKITKAIPFVSEFVKFLSELNEKSFQISAEIGTKVEVGSGTMTIGPIGLGVKGLGTISMIGELSDLNSDVLKLVLIGEFERIEKLLKSGGPDAVLGKFGGKVVELKVLYKDGHLANEAFNMISENNPKSLADEWSKNIMQLPFPDQNLLKASSKAVHDFVMGANEISISVKPKIPFSIENIEKSVKAGTISKDMNIIVSGR